MKKGITDTFCPSSPKDWRLWLKKNHVNKSAVWLIFYKKDSKLPSISWSEAVDEALCFGWIDSTIKSIDELSFMQFFSKRKSNSVWSKINKQKVVQLTEQGKMTEAGLKSIEIAKENGSWMLLDAVEELEVPKDLSKAFKSKPGSRAYFNSLSKSVQKSILQWLVLAKRPETRQKRIDEIAELAAMKQKPKQF